MVRNKNYIIFITIIIFGVLLAIEIIIIPLRFKLPRDMALMGFAATPGMTVDDNVINSMGFTGDVVSYKKDSEKIRILTLGGSSMFNRRMTEKLKSSLNNVSSRPVEILGAALRTHTSMSSLIKYRSLSEYKFDYVLIYHGINDLFVNHVDNEHFRADYSHMLPWYRRNILLDNSLIARVVYNNFIWGKRIFGMQKVWYIYPSEESENAMNYISERLFKRNLTALVEEIQQNRGTPVLMTFAWNIPENYDLESFRAGTVGYNNPEKYDQYPVELWGSSGFVREGLKRHNNILREITKHSNILMIDQEKDLGNNLRWFGDICHLSEEGTDRFIHNITDYFIQHGLIN
jgi:hypothetical protein